MKNTIGVTLTQQKPRGKEPGRSELWTPWWSGAYLLLSRGSVFSWEEPVLRLGPEWTGGTLRSWICSWEWGTWKFWRKGPWWFWGLWAPMRQSDSPPVVFPCGQWGAALGSCCWCLQTRRDKVRKARQGFRSWYRGLHGVTCLPRVLGSWFVKTLNKPNGITVKSCFGGHFL